MEDAAGIPPQSVHEARRRRAMVMVERVEAIYQDVVKRNPGEVEFHQAVKEVLECLGPVLVKYPDFTEAKIIERICEPERQTIFRVPWQDRKSTRLNSSHLA